MIEKWEFNNFLSFKKVGFSSASSKGVTEPQGFLLIYSPRVHDVLCSSQSLYGLSILLIVLVYLGMRRC